MNNLEKGSIKHLITQITAIIIAGLIIYPLFDFIGSTIITNGKFVYSVQDHIVSPVITGIVAGTTIWYFEKKSIKKKK